MCGMPCPGDTCCAGRDRAVTLSSLVYRRTCNIITGCWVWRLFALRLQCIVLAASPSAVGMIYSPECQYIRVFYGLYIIYVELIYKFLPSSTSFLLSSRFFFIAAHRWWQCQWNGLMHRGGWEVLPPRQPKQRLLLKSSPSFPVMTRSHRQMYVVSTFSEWYGRQPTASREPRVFLKRARLWLDVST